MTFDPDAILAALVGVLCAMFGWLWRQHSREVDKNDTEHEKLWTARDQDRRDAERFRGEVWQGMATKQDVRESEQRIVARLDALCKRIPK